MTVSSKSRKIDKGSVLDFGGLGIADAALLSRPSPRLVEDQLERPIMRLDLKRISQDSPFQTRQKFFDPKVHPEDEELLESVRANGVLEPIMVLEISSPGETQSYQIVFGHRRVAAARLSGLESITAIVTQDEDEARILTLAENMGGRALTPYEKALALAKLKEAHPDLSVRVLGQRTGIPFQTVSTLLRAYQESPPVLRGMFAEGLAPGAVLELKPLFEATPEGERQDLAKALQGLTRRQAKGIRALVERGAAPHAAIQAAMGAEVSQRIAPVRPPKPEPALEEDEVTSAASKPPTLLPSVGDLKAIEEIVGYTGASKAKIKRLIEQARLAYIGKEVLLFACAYAGNRGDERDAVQLAKLVCQDSELSSLLGRFLNLKKRAKKQILSMDDQRKVEFVNTVVFGK
jgi:ParB/RepB/Spo0J family partition protein